MVEFALILPLVLLVLLAAVEVAAAGRAQLEVMGAAREGARRAATTPDPASAAAAARAALPAPLRARAQISVVRPHVVGGAAVVRLRAPYRVRVPVVGGFDIVLAASATMRVER